MKVLVAEDEPDILYVYKMGMEKRGHIITTIENGEDCLATYYKSMKRHNRKPEKSLSRKISENSSGFDVVILDYKMPLKDGLQVAKQILEWNPEQRIIFVSAFVEETLRDSVKHLRQVVELIQKPFRIETVIEIIEDIEIFDSVKQLSLMVKQVKDINNQTPKEIRDLLKAAAGAQKKKAFKLNSN